MRKSAQSLSRRLLVIPLAFILAMGVAFAYWSAGSVPGGNGAARAATVNAGTAPTATGAVSTVTVTWTAKTLSSGQAVSGYVIKRYNAANVVQTIGAGCAGTVTALTCTETGVPTGAWTYTVTPVFSTNWLGPESPKSLTRTTDSTAPTNVLTLSGVSGGAVKDADTVYYRGAAAGSFRLANAVTDANSGPASSATAALGGTATGWTHAPNTVSTPAGGPYVSAVFSWIAGTTTSPTEVVTGRDVAGNSSATTLTFTDDSTAPGAGSVSYPNGDQPGASVSVSFTAGSDTGSGVATRWLQRSYAPLTGGVCGTFNTFTNIGTVNPTSPYQDSDVSPTACYQYRYVVTDEVGNRDIAVSPNVATLSYDSAVTGTAGLLSHWKLGENATELLSADSFSAGADATLLSGRSGETAASWTMAIGSTTTAETFTWSANAGGQAVRRSALGNTAYYTSAVPDSANYRVEADVVVKSVDVGDLAGVIGRVDPAGTGGGTYYTARYHGTNQRWELYAVTNGGLSSMLGSFLQTLTPGEIYHLALDMNGSTIRVLVDDKVRISVTNSALTAAGRGGIRLNGTGAASPTAGMHVDNFQITPSGYPAAVDAKATNTGAYYNGPTLGVGGAITGSSDTAAQFDGVNDYVRVAAPVGFPVGASTRSVELWFKTSGTGRQVLYNYGNRNVTGGEFGLWLDAGGTGITAWGDGADTVFTLANAANDGAWHHVVETYDGTTLTLYVDGVSRGSIAATRSTGLDHYGFTIGAVIAPNDAGTGGYFGGSIDEVALYSTALTQAAVANHYQLGSAPVADVTGPTGGSVTATGLVGTGAAYASALTINLTLDKGTDPSGLAATGAELQRATGTLTANVCGAFGAYALVTGGNDPASPKADVVPDNACYSYRYVVVDAHGNPTTYTSEPIKVDNTAPGTPTLAYSAQTNAYGTGYTMFYRPSAAGSFTVRVTSSDSTSGIASYGLPELGTGWTSTPGASGYNTYAWSSPPAAPGVKNFTATNNAGRTSSRALTLVADDTAPPTGTVTYLDGTTTSTSVSVAYTVGTDAGSGVGTYSLQRASAPLTGTTCGTFTAFTQVSNVATSPIVNPVTAGNCYMYQHVTTDRVGNMGAPATSTSVVKVVAPTYTNTVSITSGLLNYFRLGEGPITSSDNFTDVAGTNLSAHTSQDGSTWTRRAGDPSSLVITGSGQLRSESAGNVTYYTDEAPTSADYLVEVDFTAKSIGGYVGLVGRLDPAGTGAGTFYHARYNVSTTDWELFKFVNGVTTPLGISASQTLTVGQTYRIGLEMQGASIKLLVNGVVRVSATDSELTAPGRAGVRVISSVAATETTGFHLDAFEVSPPAADSKGTNIGDYFNGVTLGVTGAVASDSNKAAAFDGVNDYAQVSREVADDLSIEFWFKSTQGLGAGTQWDTGAGMVDANMAGVLADFGVSLRADGAVMAGVGSPDTTIVSSSIGYNNGSWHHVVFTRTQLDGAMRLYVDGALAGSATGSTASLTASPVISLGRLASGTNHFAGSLDEVALYGTALTAAQVTSHYAARL